MKYIFIILLTIFVIVFIGNTIIQILRARKNNSNKVNDDKINDKEIDK